jgi:antirestriction protein ArdC
MKDSAAYIQGWLQQLRNDKKFIIEASAKAQKAVDYILNEGELISLFLCESPCLV